MPLPTPMASCRACFPTRLPAMEQWARSSFSILCQGSPTPCQPVVQCVSCTLSLQTSAHSTFWREQNAYLGTSRIPHHTLCQLQTTQPTSMRVRQYPKHIESDCAMQMAIVRRISAQLITLDNKLRQYSGCTKQLEAKSSPQGGHWHHLP